MSCTQDVIDYVRKRRELPPPEMRRAIRRSAGLSLRQVAAALQVTPSAVAFWESGRRVPRDGTLRRYVALLAALTDTFERGE